TPRRWGASCSRAAGPRDRTWLSRPTSLLDELVLRHQVRRADRADPGAGDGPQHHVRAEGSVLDSDDLDETARGAVAELLVNTNVLRLHASSLRSSMSHGNCQSSGASLSTSQPSNAFARATCFLTCSTARNFTS